MIWYNIPKLEKRLATDTIAENHAYYYLLAFLVVTSIFIFFPESTTSYSGIWWDVSEFLLFLILVILGVSSTYKINAAGDNRDYSRRFISLAVIHGFRLLIWVGIIGLLYKIIMFIIPLEIFSFLNDLASTDWTEIFIFIGIFIVYYLLMVRSFKKVNSSVASIRRDEKK